jgi:hypothetical protein
LEEANHFEEEMAAACKDELTPHLTELERLKEDSLGIHKNIL